MYIYIEQGLCLDDLKFHVFSRTKTTIFQEQFVVSDYIYQDRYLVLKISCINKNSEFIRFLKQIPGYQTPIWSYLYLEWKIANILLFSGSCRNPVQ